MLHQSSIESDIDSPKDFNLCKLQKACIPRFHIFEATAAATVNTASGGAALPAVLGICGVGIKLPIAMQDIYKENQKIKKTFPRPQKPTNK